MAATIRKFKIVQTEGSRQVTCDIKHYNYNLQMIIDIGFKVNSERAVQFRKWVNHIGFGSGEGITANYLAENNNVIAIEPSKEMISNAWTDNTYTQIVGDVLTLADIDDCTFDIIICHNVLEYVDNKAMVIKELSRVLKENGFISIAKHNRAGRVMQMAVLLDDFERANKLLDGANSTASKFGAIRYYEDDEIINWEPELRIKECFGIRTFWDLQQNQEKHSEEEWQEKMIQLEMRVSQIEEFRKIAFFHHLILEKV